MVQIINKNKIKICIIGLGYVGLPLAIRCSYFFETIGFDINQRRINNLKKGLDESGEISKSELKKSSLKFTYNDNELDESNFYIVCVPTPISKFKIPDLKMLENANELIAKKLSLGNIVVYESTVYPGVTEDISKNKLEKLSKMKCDKDFSIGYSPERINPGDPNRKIETINKIISGSNTEALQIINHVYKKIIKAKIFVAKSIQVAEAAKVIENIQRDLNIALINELSMIFNKLNINIFDVLDAASTKWNFLKFYPGLVGGHCIGVDPYYLAYKANSVGVNPEIITLGRRTNENMISYTAERIIKKITMKKLNSRGNKILILGATFKQNCSDIRNSKILELKEILRSYDFEIDIFDPLIDYKSLYQDIEGLIKFPKKKSYICVILAVPHYYFLKRKINWFDNFGANKNYLFVDLNNNFEKKNKITF